MGGGDIDRARPKMSLVSVSGECITKNRSWCYGEGAQSGVLKGVTRRTRGDFMTPKLPGEKKRAFNRMKGMIGVRTRREGKPGGVA